MTMELTKAQKEKAQKIKGLKATLESDFYQNFIGSNKLKADPHLFGKIGYQFGTQNYQEWMACDETNKLRTDIYKQNIEQDTYLGIAENTPYPTNYTVAKYAKTIVQESFNSLSLEDLAKTISKEVKGGLEFRIPKKLKDINFEKIIGKLRADKKLTQDEENAQKMISFIQNEYETQLAYNKLGESRVKASNEFWKEMTKNYFPKQEPKKTE